MFKEPPAIRFPHDDEGYDFFTFPENNRIGNRTGKAVNRTFEALNNAFEIEFHECSDVMFECCARNIHSFNRLFCVLEESGEESYVRDCTHNVRFSMKRGCLYLIGPQVDFAFHFYPSTHFLAFHFNLHLYHYQELFCKDPIFCELSRREAEIRRLHELFYSPEITAGVICEVRSIIFRCLSPFLDGINLESQRRNYQKYQIVLDYLHSAGNATTTIGELAERCHMSGDLLSRSFSRDLGIPLKRYMTRLLLANAEKLLRDPSMKICDVAARLQFADEYYFSRFFKKNTGNSPSEFRRLHVR